ncbi:MAG: hypothetical protein M0D55_19860 [Elusimicrobiota bacterium]|nr:MAG: hypothetical protein M0D55_19860 [Elusimicrobiota bacterium]
MKISMLMLAVLLAGPWAAARAEDHDRDDEERVAVDKGERGDHDEDSWGGRGRREEREIEVRVDEKRRERRGDRDGERGGPRGGPGGFGRGGEDPETREKHAKYREAEKRVREIARRAGGGKADAAVKTEARKAVSDLFDAKLALDTAMLAKMEKMVAERREKIAKRKSEKERLVDQKTARILGEGDDWD